MKSTAALVSLLSLALAAPIPFVIVHDLEAAPPALHGHHHPAAPVSLRPAAQNPQRFRILEEDDDADAAAQQPIDNRPITPSRNLSPSEALASPQPVATTYLLALARLKAAPAAHDGPSTPADAAAVAPGSSIVQAEMGVVPEPRRRVGLPCYAVRHAYRRREYTDVLAIGLVATFLLVIVVVETWEGVVERARQYAGAQGPIHLDDEDEEEPDEKTPLSIQAEPLPAAELEDSRATESTSSEAGVER